MNPGPTEAAQKYVFDEEWYEKEELRLLPGLLDGVKTFVDLGASVGPYTHCASGVIRQGRILAIEANPDTYARLKENCLRWSEESGNAIETRHAAIADAPGTMDFFIPDESSSALVGSLFENTNVAGRSRKVAVECVTLDSLFPDSSPELVKVDVEGAEYRVLQGAHGLLTRGVSRFLIEIHPWGDAGLQKTPADIFEFLHSYGYDFDLVARHWLFTKAEPSVRMRIKHFGIMIIMRNLWLKERLKKIVIRWRRLRSP